MCGSCEERKRERDAILIYSSSFFSLVWEIGRREKANHFSPGEEHAPFLAIERLRAVLIMLISRKVRSFAASLALLPKRGTLTILSLEKTVKGGFYRAAFLYTYIYIYTVGERGRYNPTLFIKTSYHFNNRPCFLPPVLSRSLSGR